ncbi:Arm DNA-binding domain-containing protein, partial [Glaesserella parasuis]|nr:Arm DNA-binding domain-containing protein [Glaesserella parasuis]MDD2173676.1 Arm DNA-binding domain-containing protein [Glaesserella parasuis]MDE4016261.1 Arm DNA-binding domain-containing protein [Glaesserella parasuis]
MLTDSKIKSLKAKDKAYKVADRDGLYVVVSPAGTVTFRYDYRINGRRETLTIGKYGKDGISLVEAREKLMMARKMVSDGISPATEKRKKKNQIKSANNFEAFALKYIAETDFADRATAYVVHFSTYTPSNSSSRNSSDQPAAVNFPFILCFFGCNR